MNVDCPVPLARLHDYFAGELSSDEEKALEDHVFACDGCARAFDQAGALAAALRELVPPVVSRRKLESFLSCGTPLRIVSVEPGERTFAEFSHELEFLIFNLHVELDGVKRVDFEIADKTTHTTMAFENVPFDATRGEVLVACQRHYVESFPDPEPIFRLYSVDSEGRRLLGEYVVEHRLPP